MNKSLLLIFLTALIIGHFKAYAQTSADFEKKADSISVLNANQSAITLYTKAINTAGKDAIKLSGLYNKRAAVEFGLKQTNAGIEDANKAIKLDPNNSFAYWNRAAGYATINSYQQAIKDYASAVFLAAGTLNPLITSQIYSNKAALELSIKQYKESFTDDSLAISLDIKNKNAYWNKGIAYNQLGEYELSIAAYKLTLLYEYDKDNLAQLYDNIASNERSLKQFSKAIDDENRALNLNPDKGSYYWNRGLAYQDNKDYLLAIDDFNKAMPYNRNNKESLAKLYNNRAFSEIELRNTTQAIADASAAIALNPDFGYAYWTRAIAYSSSGDHKAAMSEYKKAMQLYQGKKNSLAILYNNYVSDEYYVGKGRDLLAHCTDAIALNPDNLVPYFTRGKVYLKKLNNKEAALKDFKKVITLDTAQTSIDYIFASYYLGDTETAIDAMKNTILSSTNDASASSAYYNMACLLSLMNKPDEANIYLKTAIDKGYAKKYAYYDDDLDNIRNTSEFKALITDSIKQ